MKKKKNSDESSSVIENLIMAFIVIGVFAFGSMAIPKWKGRDIEETLRLLVNSIQNMDIGMVTDDLYTTDYYKILLQEKEMSEEEYESSVIAEYNQIRSQVSEMIGKELIKGKFSLSYEVIDTSYFTLDEIENFNKELERMGYRGKSIEDAVSVIIRMTVVDINETVSTTSLFPDSWYLTLIKIGNKWYIEEI